MNWLIGWGAALCVGALIGVLVWIFKGQTRVDERLAGVRAEPGSRSVAEPSRQLPKGRVERVPTLGAALRRFGLWQTLQIELLRAGWLLRASELVALMCATALLSTLVALLLTHNLFTTLGAAGVAGTIPWVVMKAAQTKRSKALNTQIPDALDLLTTTLRAGFAFVRGCQLIETQMHPPLAQEFGRVVDEVQFGLSIGEALNNLVLRTQDGDLELIVAAVQTQLEIGGNLAEILDNIGGMIRERVKITGEIAAATAEGRLSAGILLAMPFGLAFVVNILNPAYLKPLVTSTLGWALLGLGGVLMIVGTMIIRKLIQVEV